MTGKFHRAGGIDEGGKRGTMGERADLCERVEELVVHHLGRAYIYILSKTHATNFLLPLTISLNQVSYIAQHPIGLR